MSEQLVILRSDDASGQRAERARVVSIIRTAAARMRVADRKLPRIILIYGCALPCARVAEMELGRGMIASAKTPTGKRMWSIWLSAEATDQRVAEAVIRILDAEYELNWTEDAKLRSTAGVLSELNATLPVTNFQP